MLCVKNHMIVALFYRRKMFGSTLMRATGLVRNARYFRSTVALRDSKSATTENATKQPREPGVESVLGKFFLSRFFIIASLLVILSRDAVAA